jgi:hypothetical protein
MAKILSSDEAVEVVRTTIEEQGEINDPAMLNGMAEGIFHALQVGYGMDSGSFLSVHSHRLGHLTKQVLKLANRDVTPMPGELPRNI